MKFEKIHITTQEIYIKKNNIIYLEIKIPTNEINKYDTKKVYHEQGSKMEDKNNVININQTIRHKINCDEKNLIDFKKEKIFIFFHKTEKTANDDKDISKDIIFGYARFTLGRCFLNEERRFSWMFDIIEKEGNNNKNNIKLNVDNNDNLIINNNKNEENKYDKNGERIIGNFEISVHLK